MPRAITLEDLRRHAVARSLSQPTTLLRAIERLGFVQADPIRAPARAEDLILRHRVAGYRAGDLHRAYPQLPVEEDCLVNYGFLPRSLLKLVHPRQPKRPWDPATATQAQEVLAYIEARGPTHPRDVRSAFAHGRVQGHWGEELNASTHLLDGLHYRGLLRVVRREAGTRVYEAVKHAPSDQTPAQCATQLVELVGQIYAPLPTRTLAYLVQLLGYGAPQLQAECRDALEAARRDWPQADVNGTRWLWPDGEDPGSKRWRIADEVRLLAPFDPVVWDRLRFEALWGWPYRLEAYTPAAQRRYGHYALPLLWREDVIGWANVSASRGAKSSGTGLNVSLGFAVARPKDAAFEQGLEAEIARLGQFLGHPARKPQES
jgi:uncharacterized protein YcaQ